ncbi:MAG TPA: biopolymer transporter ExbD [Planctomycetota bacterium]|jgi:biopolymer transport protein ExbD|nr:biopolymer transporter ExbD [Planctomycetota bacterium]
MECRLTPPIVPLLDVLFVLLLFLMLNDLGPREQEPMRLPKAHQIRVCWGHEYSRRLSINVHHRDDRTCPPNAHGRRCEEEGHWTVSVHGIDCSDPRVLAEVLARKASPADTRMVIRSDDRAPYGLAKQAIDVCARMGFQRIPIAARYVRED